MKHVNNNEAIEILKRDSLAEGGFAGLKEHRLVKEPKLFGANENKDGSWPGLGRFVYLADARFMPHGETHMHNHQEIDVISVLVDGRILHEGSLENGKDMQRNDVQVQRAGGEGFSHNEINPDDEWNRMIQIWVLPEQPGQAASYKMYQPVTGKLTRIYGGNADCSTSVCDKANGNIENANVDFPAKTKIDVAVLTDGQSIKVEQPFLAYITRGAGSANNQAIEDGSLIRGVSLNFEATEDVQLIVVHH